MRAAAPRSPACRLETLAAGPAATIQWCPPCGTVSVNIGAVTVRLDAAACESLWAILGEALINLQRRMTAKEAEQSPARPPTGLPS
ncbi:MAG: hypothetical protein HUU21_06650 [Polyangiaceae bacterium]|nr:hypothetical protein [Polyangiaceae bacterium]NUQ73215.1 hypothetical protein [Polyangiaceae bacterium]